MSSNGVLFFEGETDSPIGSCPSANNTWSGIAALWQDWEPVSVRYQKWSVSKSDFWRGVDGRSCRFSWFRGVVQVWMMEGGRGQSVAINVR